jgi:hypothetical protein
MAPFRFFSWMYLILVIRMPKTTCVLTIHGLNDNVRKNTPSLFFFHVYSRDNI